MMDWQDLTLDEKTDLAILGARIDAGGYADDRAPMMYATWDADMGRIEAVCPYRLAIEIE